MDTQEEQKFKQICSDFSKLLVGKICKQSEIIQDSDSFKNNIQLKEAISLLKSLQKELIYETFRDLQYTLKYALQGKVYIKHEVYQKRPTT